MDLTSLPPELTLILPRLGAAVLFGAAIGWEREAGHRAAGLRTLTLVSLGAASFILAGQAFAPAPADAPTSHPDMSRLIQGIIGGIGFLGAGTIIQSRHSVKGVTTAAAIWLVAAIGTLCGLGLYATAAITTILTFVILRLSPLEAAVFDHKGKRPKVEKPEDEPHD